jgi:hypothetical protein
VYVTFNDGFLLEVQEGEMVKYRRKMMHPELLKRAVLAEFVKLIDKIANEKPDLGWSEPGMKPSHFFTCIHSSYLTIF